MVYHIGYNFIQAVKYLQIPKIKQKEIEETASCSSGKCQYYVIVLKEPKLEEIKPTESACVKFYHGNTHLLIDSALQLVT
jgi:hypothetical protein